MSAVEKAIRDEEIKKSEAYAGDAAWAGKPFIPVVFSTFGGHGKAANEHLLVPLAHRMHKVYGVELRRAKQLVEIALQVPMMRRIAKRGIKQLDRIQLMGGPARGTPGIAEVLRREASF